MQLLEKWTLFKKPNQRPEPMNEKMFSQLKVWMDAPFVIDEDTESLLGIFYLAQLMKIPEKQIIETLLKRGQAIHHPITSALSLLPTIMSGYTKEQNKVFYDNIPELKTEDPVYNIYVAIDKREESIIYSEKAKSFVSVYQVPPKCKKVSLYSAIKKHKDMYPDEWDLRDADRSLGYYIFEPAPDGVVPNNYSLQEGDFSNMKQLLESLVYEEQLESEIDETSGYDAAIESMMLLEGLGSKDIPDEYRKEAIKSFAAICKYAKADTVSSNAKALVKADKKLSKISRVYAMPFIQCADGIVAEDVALKFKSLGYKKSVNKDVTKKNNVTYYFLKPIGSEGYINPIVSVCEKGSKLDKGKISVTFSYAFKDKVTDDQLKLFK